MFIFTRIYILSIIINHTMSIFLQRWVGLINFYTLYIFVLLKCVMNILKIWRMKALSISHGCLMRIHIWYIFFFPSLFFFFFFFLYIHILSTESLQLLDWLLNARGMRCKCIYVLSVMQNDENFFFFSICMSSISGRFDYFVSAAREKTELYYQCDYKRVCNACVDVKRKKKKLEIKKNWCPLLR